MADSSDSIYSSPWVRGGALGLGAGIIGSNIFGGGAKYRNPASAADPYLSQIPETLHPYYDPYVEAGRRVMPGLEKTYGGLATNPGENYAEIGAGFKESPGYHFALTQALNAGNNAAAAGGMLGSPQHVQQNEQIAEGLASQDFDRYIQHVLGLQGQGLQGLQGLETQGYGASTDLGTSLANALMSRAGLAYKGVAGQNEYEQAKAKARADEIGSIFGGLGSVAKLAGL